MSVENFSDFLSCLVSLIAIYQFVKTERKSKKKKQKKRKQLFKGANLTFAPFFIPFSQRQQILLYGAKKQVSKINFVQNKCKYYLT